MVWESEGNQGFPLVAFIHTKTSYGDFMNDFPNVSRPQPVSPASQNVRSNSHPARQNATIGVEMRTGTEGETKAASEVVDNKKPAAEVSHAARLIREVTQNQRRDLSFDVDEESGRIIIQVYDSETRELIRTIPPEEARAMMPGIEDLAGKVKEGLFVKTSA